MVMPNFLDRLKVKTPSYNIFQYPVVHNKLDMQIGRNIPVKWLELHAGEECDIKISQLTRFMPMTNPIFHQVDLEFIPFFVPFRLLEDFGFPARDYFNPATPDSERPPMPMIDAYRLYDGVDAIVGSIWDYLRYPTFTHLIRILQNQDNSQFSVSAYGSTSGNMRYSDIVVLFPETGNPRGFHISSSSYNFSVDVYSFASWVFRRLLRLRGASESDINTAVPINGNWNNPSWSWDDYFQITGERVDEAMNLYLSYLTNSIVKSYLYSNRSSLRPLSLLPWLCYTRLIYDWFINTNLTDISSVPDKMKELLFEISDGSTFGGALLNIGWDTPGDDLSYFFPWSDDDGNGGYVARIAFSLWQRDYFTGAMPNSQSGDAVPIPANGTIPDLANARKLQWFRTLTQFGGKRFIDQIFAHRGVKSSDARLDRCEVIGEKKVFHLQISDVLQTSQSTIDSVQGDFAGHGISYGSDHLCHYRAEEPGLVMVIGRCRPKNSYVGVVPKLLLKSDFYDFENPEFDNVGMEPVMFDELQMSFGNQNRIFGWQRKYMDYMTDTDEYHGHFTTSLMNWHLGRSFSNGHPVLNTQFSVIKSDGTDDLNRIFASPGYRWNVLADLAFDIQVSRPLSKVIEFDF